jgi:dTDP-4-amino-4,6-dideoxygalactose transaminase
MTMKNEPIYVTQPYLPPLQEFIPYLEKIWDSRVLTNKGPFHRQLEQALGEYLGVDHIALFANGTLALVTALQALRITGRGHHHPLLLRGDGALSVVERHQAGVRRHRSANAQS